MCGGFIVGLCVCASGGECARNECACVRACVCVCMSLSSLSSLVSVFGAQHGVPGMLMNVAIGRVLLLPNLTLTHRSKYLHTHTPTHTGALTHTHTHTHTHTLTHTYACVYILIHTTRSHIHTHTCVHTHSHTHSLRLCYQ